MPSVSQEHIYRNGYARCVPRTHICTGMGLPAASQKYIYRNGNARCVPRTHLQEWLWPLCHKNTFTGMVMPAVSQEHIYRNGYARFVLKKHFQKWLWPPPPKFTFTGLVMTAASKITFIEITFIRMGYAAASQKHIYRNGYARRISRTHLQEWLCLPSPKNTFTGKLCSPHPKNHL